jgi:hypothetical protein
MHQFRQISSVVWKDKKPVVLLSTHAFSIYFPCMLINTIPRKNGVVREDIMTFPMHFEYTTHMCGANMVDQLRALYSMQNRTYKWWHRIFFFFLDMTIVNIFIIYLAKCKGRSKPSMSHLQFRVELYETLLQQWGRGINQRPPRCRSYYYPSSAKAWKPCVVCNGS